MRRRGLDGLRGFHGFRGFPRLLGFCGGLRRGPRGGLGDGPRGGREDSPPGLLLLLGSFALTAYAGIRLLRGDWTGILLWLVGAAVVHDLVLLPLYGLADRAVRAVLRAPAPWINHVRVPAFLSGLLLLVWYPLILRRQPGRYERSTGLSADVFWHRWLLITGGLCTLSALWWVVRAGWGRWGRRRRSVCAEAP